MSVEMKEARAALAVIFLVVLLVGCAASRQPTVDIPLQKGAPVVYIHPLGRMDRQVSVGVLPFQVPPNMGREQADGVAALFKEVLLGKRIFRTVRFLDRPYRDLDEAAAEGRRAGVDLVLAGRVHYALEGTELGGARVELSIRIINARSGNTFWYIAQAMDQKMDYPDLGFGRRLLASFSPPPVRKSAGAPAVPNMVLEIAADMAEVMAGARAVRR